MRPLLRVYTDKLRVYTERKKLVKHDLHAFSSPLLPYNTPLMNFLVSPASEVEDIHLFFDKPAHSLPSAIYLTSYSPAGECHSPAP